MMNNHVMYLTQKRLITRTLEVNDMKIPPEMPQKSLMNGILTEQYMPD